MKMFTESVHGRIVKFLGCVVFCLVGWGTFLSFMAMVLSE